jgi:hypothetical protein
MLRVTRCAFQVNPGSAGIYGLTQGRKARKGFKIQINSFGRLGGFVRVSEFPVSSFRFQTTTRNP